jgi:hypothetical protein
MVRLTEVEDEHFSEKPAATGDDVLLADDDDDYTDTGTTYPFFNFSRSPFCEYQRLPVALARA